MKGTHTGGEFVVNYFHNYKLGGEVGHDTSRGIMLLL